MENLEDLRACAQQQIKLCNIQLCLENDDRKSSMEHKKIYFIISWLRQLYFSEENDMMLIRGEVVFYRLKIRSKVHMLHI